MLKPVTERGVIIEDRWFSMKEICEYLGVSHDTISRWIAKDMPALNNIGEIIIMEGETSRRKEVKGDENANRLSFLGVYCKMFWTSKKIWKQYRPKVIVSTGSNIAVPLFVIGKIHGSKIIYVETRAKVYARSMTGILVRRMADQIFVQWPEMLKLYPEAKYCGTLV